MNLVTFRDCDTFDVGSSMELRSYASRTAEWFRPWLQRSCRRQKKFRQPRWSAASKKFPRISSLPKFGSKLSMFWPSLFWFVDIVLVGSRGCSIATSFHHSLPSLVHGSQCKHYQNDQRKMFGAGPSSKGCGSEVFWGADLSGSAVRQWREKCRRAVPICIKRLGIFERAG